MMSQQKKKVNKLENNCPTCKKEVGDKDEGIQCELCLKWFHILCLGMSRETYKFLMNPVNMNIHWFCKTCNVNAITTIRMLQDVKNELKDTNKSVDLLTIEFQKLKASYSDIVSRLDKVEKVHTNETTSTNLTTSNLDKRLESFEIFKIKNNLIVNNLPEVQNARDEDKVDKLMRNLELADVKVYTMGRMGPKLDGKNRPLKLRVDNYNDKMRILTNARKLRECEGYTNIYVHPDRTKLQQIEGKKLRDELKRRKSNGESNLVITGGKIVSRQQ